MTTPVGPVPSVRRAGTTADPDLEKQIQGLRADMEKRIQDVKVLVIVVLVVVILLNPGVMELVGRILGVVK